MTAAATRPRPRDRSVRYHLAVLAMALALPVTLFVGVLLWRFADAERARLEGQASSVARAAAHAVDQELAGLVSMVDVLSLFDSLRTGDLQTFDGQARGVRERTGINVVLRDPSGRQLINTRRPRGEPLPDSVLDFDAEALRTGRAVVSGLFTGAVAQEPLFAVGRPVARGDAEGGEAAYLISLSLPVERVRQALVADLASSGVPADWIVAVVDGAGLILTRNRTTEGFVGRPATRDFQDSTRGRSEGSWKGTTVDGTPVFAAFVRSRLSGWSVGVGVPESVLDAPLRRALLLLLALGAGVGALS
ncbi:MAG: cache domain-containing protein, partial [Acetobacteraceae bacterium]|nr:cache domain-containing protein [Acetobacteraceae bacterium]